jgi:hypothetical protein
MGMAAKLKVGSVVFFGDVNRFVTITKIDADGKYVKVYADGPESIRFGRESELTRKRPDEVNREPKT